MDEPVPEEPTRIVPEEPTRIVPEIQEEWKSCCLRMDKNAVKYFFQVGVLSALIIFSASMLVIDPDCNSQRNYSSLLMICLGTLIPTPKLDR
jgi:hypothetical protein